MRGLSPLRLDNCHACRYLEAAEVVSAEPVFPVRWLGAILPLAMTLTVIAAGMIHAVHVGGFFHEADEGTAAHLFQLLMPAQVPIIGLFAATQLPRDRAWALRVLALQLTAAAALFAGVFFLT